MMEVLFYIASLVALSATGLALSRSNAVHALIYLIVSLLAVAVVFFLLGAPFAAALEILIYAGAIMVLFVFVIMMLNLGEAGDARERQCRPGSTGAWGGLSRHREGCGAHALATERSGQSRPEGYL